MLIIKKIGAVLCVLEKKGNNNSNEFFFFGYFTSLFLEVIRFGMRVLFKIPVLFRTL